MTGFLGPNGASKSTTTHMIMGLDHSDSGQVTLNGGRTDDDLPWPLREVGALIDAKAVDPDRAAFGHLWMLAQTNDIPRSRVDAVLDLVGMASVARRPSTKLATGQQITADEDHSPVFWSSVTTAFRSDPAVVFDLYNEPHGISWSCWLDGCTTLAGWQAAGMQQLPDVRATGATQPVMVAGLQ